MRPTECSWKCGTHRSDTQEERPFTRSALQWRLKCTAVAVAVHCRSGCSALRPKPALSGVALQIFLYSLTHVRQSPFDWQKPAQGKMAVRDT